MRLTGPTGTGTVLLRYYLGGRYEFDQKRGSSTNEERDYLGSITLVATANGTLVAEYSYDPWGLPTSRRTTTATPIVLTIR